MHVYRILGGVFLIGWGILLLRKPNLFRRGMWMKTGIAQRNLSPEAYIKYSRGVGVFNIALGIAFFAWGLFGH